MAVHSLLLLRGTAFWRLNFIPKKARLPVLKFFKPLSAHFHDHSSRYRSIGRPSGPTTARAARSTYDLSGGCSLLCFALGRRGRQLLACGGLERRLYR